MYKTIQALIMGVFILTATVSSVTAADFDWKTDLDEAVAESTTTGKPVFLFAGRATCGNCKYMKSTIMKTTKPNVVSALNDYIMVYVDVDNDTGYYAYTTGLSSFTLPLICILPVNGEKETVYRSTGIITAQTLYDALIEYKDAEVEINPLKFVELSWYTNLTEAKQAAKDEDKPLLIYAGNSSSGLTDYYRESIFNRLEDPAVKGELISNYILFFEDTDVSMNFWKYLNSNSPVTLPLVGIVTDIDGSSFVYKATGYLKYEDVYSNLTKFR